MINMKQNKHSIKQILMTSLCMVSALTFGGDGNLGQPLLAGTLQPPAQVGMGSPHTAPDMTLKDVIIGQLIKQVMHSQYVKFMAIQDAVMRILWR